MRFNTGRPIRLNTRRAPGTPAAEKPQLPEDVMSDRLQRLQALLTDQQRTIQQSMVGRDVNVLFEKEGRTTGQMIGKSEYLHAVFADAPLDVLGQIRRVRITHASANSLGGEILLTAECAFDCSALGCLVFPATHQSLRNRRNVSQLGTICSDLCFQYSLNLLRVGSIIVDSVP